MQHQALKQKTDLHMSRKIWHCVGICSMVLIYHLLTIKIVWLLWTLVTLAIVPADFLRHRRPGLNRATLKIFGPLMRENEFASISGMTYLLIGTAFLLLLRDKNVIVMTLLFLAFGDPIASFFGIRFGKDKIIGNKTLQGTIAAFVVCTVIAFIYCYLNGLMIERLFIVAPIAGLIGAVAELVPIGKLEDNLTFPVLGGSLLWLLFQVYGGLGA